MGLRNWIKSKKAKAMVVLGSFALLLGVGASVATTNSVKENEVVETKAATSDWKLVGSDFDNFGTEKAFSTITLNSSTYYYITVTLSSNATFRFKYTNNWNNTLGYSHFGGASNAARTGFETSWFVDADNDNNFKVASSGTYTFLLANNFDGYGDKSYGIYCFKGSPNQTYYLNTNGHWAGTPKCYGWSDVTTDGCLVKDGTTWSAWSGETMTAVAGKTNVYTITYPIPPHNIIFNYNGADATKTGTLAPASGQYYSLTSATVGAWNSRANWAVKPYAKFYKGSSLQGTENLAWEYVLDGSTHSPSTWSTYDYNGTTYTFEGRYTNEGCTTSYSPSSVSGSLNYYVKFVDQNNYTVTYYSVVDGVLQEGSANVSVTCGTLFSSITEPTLYGCAFDGWYAEASCSSGLAATEVTADRTVYAKFTSLQSSTAIYFDIGTDFYTSLTTSSAGTFYTFVKYWNNTKSVSAMVKAKELTAIAFANHKFFRVQVPTDAEGFLVCVGDSDFTNLWQQTIDLAIGSGDETTHNNGHNLFVVKSGGDGQKRSGDWVDIVYYLEVASDTSFASDLTTYNMSSPKNASTGNAAEVLGVTVPANYYVRAQYFIDASNYGYNITEGGEDGDSDSSNWVYTQQVSGVGIEFNAEKTCNFYINGSGDIWVVDCSGIDAGGYIYISTQLTPAEIKVDCTVSGRSYFSHAKLSTVDGVTSTSTLTFNGVKGMIVVPIYNLRNGNTYSAGTAYSLSLTSASDSSRTTDVTGVTVSTTEPIYYINLSTSSSWSASTAVATTHGEAAKVAYEIDAAIAGASNASVCNIDKATATTLCEDYDNASSDSCLTGASISTWSSVKPTYSGNQNATLPAIRAELGNIAGGNYVIASLASFTKPGNEQSPLTVTLWVVLGAGILGLGAIGAAYFVSKKKNRTNA